MRQQVLTPCHVCAFFLAGLMTLSMSQFNLVSDFQGWNCGEITRCGKFGQICGGYNVKGHASDIKNTFTLPPGTYWVELDFIKIDFWFVRAKQQCVGGCLGV